MSTTSPDERRKAFIAEWDHKVVRLEDELQNMVKLVAMQLDTLKKSITGGFAYKQEAISLSDLKALKELTAAMNSLTDSKIRLDKTAKDRAEKMTPEEERAAVYAYLRALPHTDRGEFLRQALIYHNEQAVLRGGRQIKANTETLAAENDDGRTEPNDRS